MMASRIVCKDGNFQKVQDLDACGYVFSPTLSTLTDVVPENICEPPASFATRPVFRSHPAHFIDQLYNCGIGEFSPVMPFETVGVRKHNMGKAAN
jgi:hypothetical protein